MNNQNIMCQICLSYAGNSDDFLIKFISGHHPNCKNFDIEKFKNKIIELEKRVETFSIRRSNNAEETL